MVTLTFHADPRRTAPALQTRPDAIDKPMEAPCKAKVLKPAQVESWQSSSFDLLSGLQVRDLSETMPGRLFDELFKGRPPLRA